jgi:hypothetical protein
MIARNVMAALDPPGSARMHYPARETALRCIVGFATAKLLLHFVAVWVTPYEIHRDEFLYLAMGEHLRLWGMDFPPAIAVLAKVARWVFGDTLFAVRFFPALAGAATIILGAAIVREFGGGRNAQILAMLTLFFDPLFIRPAALFQPVVLDQFCWTLGFLAVAKILREPERIQYWALLGVACGLGLLTKISILFFGFSLFVALVCSPQRRLVVSRGAWLATGLALLIGAPTVVGQVRLHFPVITWMTDLQNQQLRRVTPWEYLFGQVWMLGPALILAFAGLVFLLRNRLFRVAGWTCVVAFLLLLVLHGKAYYIGPIYPMLFAAGAVAFEQLQGARRRVAELALVTVLVLSGLILLPLGVAVLKPELMARYCARLGLQAAVTTNRGTVLPLPQDYADMLGWEMQVKAVAAAFASVPAESRSRTGLVARNYGEAGALEFYGKRYGLPRRIMLPDNVTLWPADPSCDTVVTIGISSMDLSSFFQNVRVVSRFDYSWMVQEERDRVICVADTPIRKLPEGWKKR